MVQLRLGAIVEALGGELTGDASTLITALAPLESATPSELSFLSNPRYQQQLAASQAACVIVAPRCAPWPSSAVPVPADQPYLYFARVTQLWRHAQGHGPRAGIHPSAVVDPQAVWCTPRPVSVRCVVERAPGGRPHGAQVTGDAGGRLRGRRALHPACRWVG